MNCFGGAMDWTLIKKDKYVVSEWSGGTTTQLAIFPESAVYADRDFIWRLSSAEVLTPESDFTPLPDYDRLISVVSGARDLKVSGRERVTLKPLQVLAFDGAVSTKSWGLCRDFKLMTRKGKCRGSLKTFELSAGSSAVWTPDAGTVDADGRCVHLAIYCARGEILLPEDGVAAHESELLLCRSGAYASIPLRSKTRCIIFTMAAELL